MRAHVTTLNRLRTRIDRLDGQLVSLLVRRMRVAAAIGRAKQAMGEETYAPSREREVLQRVARLGGRRISCRALEAIYREIMSGALALEGDLAVGLLRSASPVGVLAAREHFGGSVRYRFFSSPAALRAALRAGRVQVAVLEEGLLAGLALGVWRSAFASRQIWVAASIPRPEGARYLAVTRRTVDAGPRPVALAVARVRRVPRAPALPARWTARRVLSSAGPTWILGGAGPRSAEELQVRLGADRVVLLGQVPDAPGCR